MPTATKKIIRELERAGYRVELTNGSHLKITHPDMDGPVFASSSPSDVRAMKEVFAMCRRKRRQRGGPAIGFVCAMALAGCGPTMVVLKNPATGEVAQCKGDAWANWNPYAATEACAKGYEASGWQRMGSY